MKYEHYMYSRDRNDIQTVLLWVDNTKNNKLKNDLNTAQTVSDVPL